MNMAIKGWEYCTNSSFCVGGTTGLITPKILVPDGCLVDGRHNPLVVVEVAYTQSVRQVLQKVKENWLRAPKIVAVIVIKLDESPGYRKPAADKAQTEPALSSEEWFDRQWPLDKDIAYDGHTWYGRSYTRFIIFMKCADGPRNESTDVCSRSHSFFGITLTINVQILIQCLSPQTLDSLTGNNKRKCECSPSNDSNGNDYGSEVQEPHIVGDEAEQDRQAMRRILEDYNISIDELSKRLGADWEVITLVCLSFVLRGV